MVNVEEKKVTGGQPFIKEMGSLSYYLREEGR